MHSIANAPSCQLVVRSESGGANAKEWERIAGGEVLVPGTPNTYGDVWSAEAIRRAAYLFMEEGFEIDVNHDNVDVSGSIKVIESFIARDGDPDFIKGAWVVFMRVTDDDTWQDILRGEINGYSYEALVRFSPALLTVEDDFERTGITAPDTGDGHTHEFYAMVDEDNRPIMGGTSITQGHSHVISTHTITDAALNQDFVEHMHKFNLVQGKYGK